LNLYLCLYLKEEEIRGHRDEGHRDEKGKVGDGKGRRMKQGEPGSAAFCSADFDSSFDLTSSFSSAKAALAP
jgi:hypothetical protein